MATSLTGRIGASAQLTYDGGSDTSELVDSIANSTIPAWTIVNGTGANQADLMWHDQRTLGTSATENIDLAGSLSTPFGAAATFARIKGIIIYAATTNGALIQVGGAAANGFINWVASATDIIQVRAGGTFSLTAPDATAYAVTAGTGDILKITNTDGAASATYDIYLIGASA